MLMLERGDMESLKKLLRDGSVWGVAPFDSSHS